MSQQKGGSVKKSKWCLWGFLFIAPITLFGLFGGVLELFRENGSLLSGFLNGLGLGVLFTVICTVGVFGWEYMRDEANKGKLWSYILIGSLIAVIVSSYLAIDLGKPSCEDREAGTYSACTQYADDGFEVTTEQRWEKFLNTLPITSIVTVLISIMAYGVVHGKELKE